MKCTSEMKQQNQAGWNKLKYRVQQLGELRILKDNNFAWDLR